MGTTTSTALTPSEKTQTQTNLTAMRNLNVGTVSSGFRYVATFDGTNNNKSNLPLSDSDLQTNVANIADLDTAAGRSNLGLRGAYFEGVGTGRANGN
ncbi:MAG: hypothetical protein H7293_05750 [Candidatus Saccharibacteria bacterium]|nr:hypothetical protein [Rhodoferax sp.]